ncbi:ribulose-phosphate 3-epimerase [Chloroflexi bacterium TSY]|nr:ribulose-phosphate 3-epimerase [Chloroflexi bacterium TSY]
MDNIDQNTIKIAPSILTADFGHLDAQIRAAEEGGADTIHLDVMDGTFVPNISFGPMVIQWVRRATSLPLDVHLMVQEPVRYLSDYKDAGADSITVHAEACLHLHRTLQSIQDLGLQIGVAINPATSIQAIEEVVPLVDLVLLMSVNPGFGGQRFIEQTKEKLQRMRALLDKVKPACDLQVDGGVGVRNIAEIVQCGANVFVVGSGVYNDKASVATNIAALRNALEI